MASQVLSGTGPVSYTNNTGENVRVVINFLEWGASGGPNDNIVLSWGAGSVNIACRLRGAIGRNLAYNVQKVDYTTFNSVTVFSVANNGVVIDDAGPGINSRVSLLAPTEVMLAPGGTFSTSLTGIPTTPPDSTIKGYNIVVIPEGG